MTKYEYGLLHTHIIPKPYEYKKEIYDNNIFCFDIEVTSGWYTPEHKIIAFDKTKSKKYWKQCIPLSVVYIWQFSVNDIVFYGRELNDFKILTDELKEIVINPTIWVHNLAYEYQFLLNIFDVENVFARKPHKPMYAIFDGIKFRCSYFLTRLSLKAWGENVGVVEKKVGQLDYNVLRTPLTPLTNENFEYCKYDVLVMYYGLEKYLDKYTYIENIPLTQTGEVRRVVKNLYKDNYNYHKKMTKLLPRDKDEYLFMKECFSGGYTHSNYLNTNMVIENVQSKDIASSYPLVMIAEKFPMTKWAYVREYELEKYRHNDKYSLLMQITLYDVKSICSMTYISASKCYEKLNVINDNGRVLKAKKISLYCTNIDLDIIEQAYSYSKIKYHKIYYAINEYLDTDYVRYILELYGNKTQLKDVAGKEPIYMQSKQFINSLYGMMVTDLVSDNYIFINDLWQNNSQDIESVLADLQSRQYKNFLAYQHGIFVTAYARRNLWQTILQIDKDVIYVDTDSVKYIGDYESVFETYNKEVVQKLEKAMDYHKIPMHLTRPKTPKGKEKQIGIYETERTYAQFKTLGAKRYAYTYDDSPQVHITVSGVNKDEGAKALTDIHDFSPDFVFDTDYTKKLIFTYLSDMPYILWNEGQADEYLSKQRYGINALPTTYSMKISDEYTDLLLGRLQKYI